MGRCHCSEKGHLAAWLVEINVLVRSSAGVCGPTATRVTRRNAMLFGFHTQNSIGAIGLPGLCETGCKLEGARPPGCTFEGVAARSSARLLK